MELLSPAGSREALEAAVQSGADAVYMGFGAFNARRSAKNFTDDDFAAAVHYCHLHGVKVYLTLNTLLTDRELPQAADALKKASAMGVDAVLVQDWGLWHMAREAAPDVPLHASTQMSLFTLGGANFAAKLGMERVVLARELSARDIETICRACPAEVEVFGHGALCMCYSGQCEMSAVIGSRSGNRGACAQPCRLPYGVDGPCRGGHPLSLKDANLSGYLRQMEQMGVACVKLEGRMKRPEYVAVITGIYRRLIDERRAPTREESQQLERAFSRSGFTDGYWRGRTGADMFGVRPEDARWPEDWFAQSMEGMKELTKDIDRAQVAGIGFGGQMHGLVTLDKDDNVIRPAILWNDGRTGEETEYLNTVIGKDKLSQYTANIAFAGFTAPKILWMQKNEPENFKKVVKIMLPKDYLAYRLSGSFCTDVSDASGMLLLDVKNRCWSKEMLEICGITEEQLPKLYESWEVVGTLKPEIAKELGFSENVKVVAGAGDNAAAAVGTGTVGDGQCNISLGTSGTVFISSKNFGVDENNALHSFCHADGSYHLMGCMLSAASCNKWWAEEILQTKDFAAEQAPIQKLGENHVFFLPYLMGERSPHNNPDARGVFFGMSMDSTRADMTQAVLEGVAFGLRDSLEVARNLGIKIERTKICGGGAKSPLWKKIIANVMNLKVDVLENEEGPSMGGAMLAAVGCGAYPDVETIGKKFAKVVDTVEPDPELVAKYEERYQKFRTLYPAMKPLF